MLGDVSCDCLVECCCNVMWTSGLSLAAAGRQRCWSVGCRSMPGSTISSRCSRSTATCSTATQRTRVMPTHRRCTSPSKHRSRRSSEYSTINRIYRISLLFLSLLIFCCLDKAQDLHSLFLFFACVCTNDRFFLIFFFLKIICITHILIAWCELVINLWSICFCRFHRTLHSLSEQTGCFVIMCVYGETKNYVGLVTILLSTHVRFNWTIRLFGWN